jgi:hypothetical protein
MSTLRDIEGERKLGKNVGGVFVSKKILDFFMGVLYL